MVLYVGALWLVGVSEVRGVFTFMRARILLHP